MAKDHKSYGFAARYIVESGDIERRRVAYEQGDLTCQPTSNHTPIRSTHHDK